jgi:fatty-acyl-CoA synthase
VHNARLTYEELDSLADRWAGVLERSGIVRGDRVAAISGNRTDLIALFFACTRLGAALVPLNWRLASPELGAILQHAKPQLVIGESRFRSSLEGGAGTNVIRWIDIDDEAPRLLESAVRLTSDVPCEAEDAALILYTSGSTGLPKGVIIPQRQIFYNAVATTSAWELSHTDVAPLSTPLFHTGGWSVFAIPLWHRGGTVVMFNQFDPNGFLALWP